MAEGRRKKFALLFATARKLRIKYSLAAAGIKLQFWERNVKLIMAYFLQMNEYVYIIMHHTPLSFSH